MTGVALRLQRISLVLPQEFAIPKSVRFPSKFVTFGTPSPRFADVLMKEQLGITDATTMISSSLTAWGKSLPSAPTPTKRGRPRSNTRRKEKEEKKQHKKRRERGKESK